MVIHNILLSGPRKSHVPILSHIIPENPIPKSWDILGFSRTNPRNNPRIS
jgi:hypothetical protein